MRYQAFTEKVRNTFMGLSPDYIGTAHGRAGTKVEQKIDGTPIVDLDNYTLAALRELITTEFPDDYTIGEEDQKSDAEMKRILARDGQYQWTIDGLDGTWHFKRGTNSYGGMIARRLGKNILYTAIFRPIDFELRGNGFFFAERGEGAWEWCDDHSDYHSLRTAADGELERRTILLEGSSKMFFRKPMVNIGANETTRPSLSSCIAATTVARGDASAVVTIGHKPWDGWPIVCMVQAAGGIVTDHQGNPLSAENCSEVIAAANPTDHKRILDLLNKQ